MDIHKEFPEQLDALRKELKIYGWDRAESYGSNPSYLDVYIPAPKQDSYTISLQRVYDPIVVKKTERLPHMVMRQPPMFSLNSFGFAPCLFPH